MKKVSELMKETGLSKKDLFDEVKKISGKEYSEKTTQISDKAAEDLIKKYISNSEKGKSEASEEDRFRKADEISGDEDSFLSGLGFSKDTPEEEVEDENDVEEDNISSKKEEPTKKYNKEELPKKEDKKEPEKKHQKNQDAKSRRSFDKTKQKSSEEKKSQEKRTTNEKVSSQNSNKRQQNQKTQSQQFSKKKQVSPRSSGTLKKKETIEISDKITVKEFSEKMGIPLSDVMKQLIMNKIMVSATSYIDFDTASLIGEELGVSINKEKSSVSVEDVISGNLQAILDDDKNSENLKERPPIVTVMGHVDHGKTKLLDYLRSSKVTEGEAGGITQSIGASQIEHSGKKITFIDTPGHELFTSLRARGSKVTDVTIVVIAADDGIKQQTKEAIDHAKDAGTPIIVAVTKIDVAPNKMEAIKGELAQQNLIPEDWGGETSVVGVSSITGQGIDELMDLILLQSEMLELKYNPDRAGVGVVLESHKDVKKGVTTSLLLMTGHLEVGNVVVVHDTYGRIRRISDWQLKDTKHIEGGDPAMILGVQNVVEPGRLIEVVSSEKEANQKIDLIKEKEENHSKHASLNNVLEKISNEEKVQLKLVLKADSYGSLEAVKYALSKISLPENIELKIIHSDIGAFSDSDITLAEAGGGFAMGFNVPFSAGVKKKAEHLGVEIKNFNIIYELVDYIERLGQGLVKVEEKEVYKGSLNVLAIFFKRGNEMILGGKVADGEAINGSYFKAYRKNEETQEMEEIAGGKVTSLKKENENVNSLPKGHECGLRIKTNRKLQDGDKVDFYMME